MQQHKRCGQYRPLPYLKIVYPLTLLGRKIIQLKRGRFTLLLLLFPHYGLLVVQGATHAAQKERIQPRRNRVIPEVFYLQRKKALP